MSTSWKPIRIDMRYPYSIIKTPFMLLQSTEFKFITLPRVKIQTAQAYYYIHIRSELHTNIRHEMSRESSSSEPLYTSLS